MPRSRPMPVPGGRESVRHHLERLLAEKDFLAAHVLSAPSGRHTLYEDPELGFVVLAHVNPTAGKSPPHDHGASWAVYGQVTEHTDMTEWRRAEGGDAPGPASLEVVRRYRLEPGHAGLYDIRAIHAITNPPAALFFPGRGPHPRNLPRPPCSTGRGGWGANQRLLPAPALLFRGGGGATLRRRFSPTRPHSCRRTPASGPPRSAGLCNNPAPCRSPCRSGPSARRRPQRPRRRSSARACAPGR